ncbi:Spermidine/putrescine transport system permease protein PotB [Nymphon striatum]|nr:Spermidine/putrescine transport system permease protein PotB [Nymphon striatum]
MAALPGTSKNKGKPSAGVFDGIGIWLLSPSWIMIGFFLLLPVFMMLVYSFLTKEFRGGVIWEPTLAAYDQFIFDRGLFGDEPPAAWDLYADRWTALRKILIPVVKPGIIAGCILVFVPSLGAFLAPDLLGGAKTFMIGSLIEEQFKGNAGNWPFGAAASMILLTMVLIVLMFYARQQTRSYGGER